MLLCCAQRYTGLGFDSCAKVVLGYGESFKIHQACWHDTPWVSARYGKQCVLKLRLRAYRMQWNCYIVDNFINFQVIRGIEVHACILRQWQDWHLGATSILTSYKGSKVGGSSCLIRFWQLLWLPFLWSKSVLWSNSAEKCKSHSSP